MAVSFLTTLGLLATGVSAAGHLFPDCQNGPLAGNGVCDTKSSATVRAQALVKEFTTEEKFNLVINTSPGVPRLGLPSYEWWQEALHGVASSPGVNFNKSGNYSYATSFPQPILMGAAFDDGLIKSVATVISTEARAFNNANRSGLDYWTPNINPYRDPRWGRGQETPGEDPFHIKSYVKALVSGLQGDDPEYLKIVATCKHFVGYDIENWAGNDRYEFDAQIPQQDLSEYFMQPFQACARDAKVASIMCSYNAVNGVPTCADRWLLQDVLRDHWNWTDDGYYVTSDCDAIQNIYLPHAYKPTREASAASALLAGTDLDCGTYYALHLPGAYQQGLFNESVIDQALVRLYAAQVRLGMFDPVAGQQYRSLAWSNVNTPDSQALALRAAEEGIVLLKNNNTLPIQLPTNKNFTIAVIGTWANATTDMQGNYAGIAPYLVSPYMAAAKLPNVRALYSGSPGDPTTDGYPKALAAGTQADLIIYADGSNSGESNDRNVIKWASEKMDVMTQLAGMGKPFILLTMGDQLDNTPFLQHENVSAILWAGFPGQSGGDAIMNIITGKTAPAGRLPVTQYPGHYVNDVPMTDMALRPNDTSGNPGRTYMWYNSSVAAFGSGLHYTTFVPSITSPAGSSIFDIQTLTSNCQETYKDLCTFQNVAVPVHNTGNVTSDYVALGFMAGEFGPTPYPRKRLSAYERLFDIAGGATSTAYLNLTLGSLARHDESGNLVLYPGCYSLLVDEPTLVSWNFTLTGNATTLEVWPQPGST